MNSNDLVEGGIYHLPLKFEALNANLRFTLPDGTEMLLARSLARFLEPVSVPEKTERQEVMEI